MCDIIYMEVDDMLNRKDIGIRIRALREASNLTQSNLSEFLDMDQSNLSKIEKGERPINSYDIERLSRLFCCASDYILYGVESNVRGSIAFRAGDLGNEDLEALSVVNAIALNQFEMDDILGELDDE